ncbi:MAG: DNA-primase RepB domain-containing protein [Thiobacillaceae bacterium]
MAPTTGAESGHTKADALLEQGVGANQNNVKRIHHTGCEPRPQLDAGEHAIIVGPPVGAALPSVVATLIAPVTVPAPSDKTDETDFSTVTNSDFLSAIFGTLDGRTRPFVCGFRGDPKAVFPARWAGGAWEAGVTTADGPDKNWYFTLATFSPEGAGTYKRQKKQFAALYGIMLDDIGTKASDRNHLNGLPPSWLIETSPGNYQAGYLFAAPIVDGALAEALIKATIAAGLCDPGASGPLTRYGRLPAAVNGKHEPAFACRLVEWHPARRYTPEQIADGLKLDLQQPTVSKPKASSRLARVSVGEDEVYAPRASVNPLIETLLARGLYKKPLADGKHDISCPWADEHTGGADDGAVYYEPTEHHPVGGFKCHHGHCADRKIGALINHLGIPISAAKHKAAIRVSPGELGRILDAAELELKNAGRYYQRGGQVVAIMTDPSTKDKLITTLNQPALIKALAEVAVWEKYDARSGGFIPTDPPSNHVGILYGAQGYKHLSVLNGLARQPYLRPDGSLMTRSGYDEPTGLFGTFDDAAFNVAPDPTPADAQAALRALLQLLDEFSFADDADRSAALAAMLTAAIRPSLPQAPMFHVKAPQIASGKTYLTALISAFATPTIPSATYFPPSDEECLKLLLSALLTSPAVLCFDNLTGDLLPHKTLCSALTDEFITGRILGVSKTATVGTRTLFLSSGNNVDPVRDMARRCVTIRLDPACETPAARTFRNNPVGEVRGNRGYFVSLALVIIRAWIIAGRPITPCKPLASYETWSEWIRQPLLWLGLSDPATSVFNSMAADPDRETLGRLLAAWDSVFGNRPTMVRDVVAKASRTSPSLDVVELHEVISDIADERGQINRKRLGRWIARHAGRIVGGLKFDKVPAGRNVDQWKVVSVSSVSSVSGSHPAATLSTAPGSSSSAP